MTKSMERDSFGQGYIAGWRSVQGDEEQPVIPPAPAATGKSMYLVGFHRGVRDAEAAPSREGNPR
jgi:hypothetical protein